MRDDEAGHLDEAAGDEGALRVVAVAEAVADAGRDRHDVLQRPASSTPMTSVFV